MYKRQCFYLNTTTVANCNLDADAEMLMLRFPNCRVNPFVPNPPFLYLFSGGTERCIGSKWVKIYIKYNAMAWACFHKLEVIYGLSIYYSVLFIDLVLSIFVSTKYVGQTAALCFEEEGVLLAGFFLQTWCRCLTDWMSIGF